MRLSSVGNQYVDREAPWAAIKADRAGAATILYVALRLVDSLKVIFTPFLPFSSQKLHHLLGYDGWARRAARVPRDRGRQTARSTRS